MPALAAGLPPAGLLLLAQSLTASLFLLGLRDLSAVRQQRLEELRGSSHLGQSRRGGGTTPIGGGAARLQALGGALIVIGQCLALTTKTDLPPRQYGEAVAVLVLVALLLVALPAAAPRAFERVRLLVAGGVRLLLFAQPVVRHPRGLLTVFQGAPSHRAAGLLLDLWRLLLGSRAVAMVVTPLACPLPMLPNLALLAYALHRCHQTAQFCACPKLQHAIWRGRIAWVHRLIDKLPMLVLEPADECTPDTPEAAAQQCRVFVSFIQLLVGVVAPVAIMAAVHAPIHAAAADEAARRELRRRRREASRPPRSDDGSDDGGSGSCKWSRLRACGAAVRGVYSEADAVLQHVGELLGSTRRGVVSAAAWWLTVSLCWVLALLLERE